ncbi:hypothetical protein [Nostoc sp. NIES-3756]|nr:hypothetical protein [Nostoc sp. NIES-3756]
MAQEWGVVVWLNATLRVACFATQRYREPRSGTTALTNREMRRVTHP